MINASGWFMGGVERRGAMMRRGIGLASGVSRCFLVVV